MPTLQQHPPGDIAWEEHIPSWYDPRAVKTHIYLAGACLLFLGAVRLLETHWRNAHRPPSERGTIDLEQKPRQFSSESAEEKGWQRFDSSFGTPAACQRSEPGRVRGFVPLRVVPGQLKPLGRAPTMDGVEREDWEDHYPWSALAASRGISSSPKPLQGHSTIPGSATVTERTTSGYLLRTSSPASPGRRQSESSDGFGDQLSKRAGETPKAGGGTHVHDGPPHLGQDSVAETTDGSAGSAQLRPGHLKGSSLSAVDLTVPRHFARPPQPPPLTPPTLTGAFFPFEAGRTSQSASATPALDMSFIHQPNPEYGGCSSSTDVLSSSPQGASALPRRRSYTKNVPIGIAAPATAVDAVSSYTAATTPGDDVFSRSSSPTSPPPPSGHYDPPSAPPEYKFVGGPGGPGVFLSQQEIDLQGEIISVLDDAGHGWKRHTRVYGGGVCLACVAAAERDGGQGGFYGDKVPLEDRR